MSFGSSIRERRDALGLSTRDLARLARVSYPTLSRIELGHVEPRLGTAERLADALGMEVRLVADRHRLELTDLFDALGPDGEPDWTRLRAFVDHATLHPELTGALIGGAPAASGSPLLDNLLAAIAERLADLAGIRAPRWATGLPGLDERWYPPGTPRRRALAEHEALPRFARRNLFLPESALWRSAPIGAT